MNRLAFAPLLLLAGCATAVGNGWSRADDLSIYGAMHVYARAALDQEAYCLGRAPARIAADWARDYSARQNRITARIAARYGAAAAADARRVYAPPVPCGDVPDPQWHRRYARLMRLLEIRLRLQPGRDG